MKSHNFTLLAVLFFILLTSSSCDIILGIFEAGMWVGIILVVLVIALLIWLVKKML